MQFLKNKQDAVEDHNEGSVSPPSIRKKPLGATNQRSRRNTLVGGIRKKRSKSHQQNGLGYDGDLSLSYID